MIQMLPNFITSFRIIGTFCLLFVKPLSPLFFIIYTLSGFSDVLDGFIARKMNLISEFGSKLDSIADLFFYAIMIIKVFPVLLKKLPNIFWLVLALVLVLRLSAYILAAIKYKKFTSLHTWLNKATGFMVFLIPYVINTIIFEPFAYLTSLLGAISSAEELSIHILSREYTSKNRTIFSLKK